MGALKKLMPGRRGLMPVLPKALARIAPRNPMMQKLLMPGIAMPSAEPQPAAAPMQTMPTDVGVPSANGFAGSEGLTGGGMPAGMGGKFNPMLAQLAAMRRPYNDN